MEKRESYCCYQTPLSRIINEQAYVQLGKSHGSKENPVCDGLTIAELQLLDWSQIDLSEWMAILATTGNLTDVDSEWLNPTGLTGPGTILDTEGDRLDVIERTEAHFDGVPMSDSREDLRQEIYATPPTP